MLPHYAPDTTRAAHITSLDLAGLPHRVQVVEDTHEGEAGWRSTMRGWLCAWAPASAARALGEVRQLALALGEWMGLAPEEVAVGGTRKVVDLDWLPRHQQIGITGAWWPRPVRGPRLSGNFNHTAGILRSGTVVAANTNPEAPIFRAPTSASWSTGTP